MSCLDLDQFLITENQKTGDGGWMKTRGYAEYQKDSPLFMAVTISRIMDSSI